MFLILEACRPIKQLLISFTVPVAIVVVIVFSVNGYIDDPLLDCMQDSDYAELLEIVNRGLPFTKTPHHIAIIGGGIAGLTAAKFLEDTGHKVQYLLYNLLYQC